MKRIISAILVFALLLPSAGVFAANGMTRGEAADMLLTAADDYNGTLTKSDILKGYPDGQLHEERGVTRAEALVMLRRAFGAFPALEGHNAAVAIRADDFTDVPEWAKSELADVFDAGIAAGVSPGVFAPAENVTAEQMELFCERAYSVFGTNEKDDFYAAVNRSKLNSMKLGDGKVITGTIYELSDESSAAISDIIDEIANKQNRNETEKKIYDFYKSVTNKEGRRKTGLAPIRKYLDEIDGASNIRELLAVQNDTIRDLGTAPFFGFTLTIDAKDSTKYKLILNTFSPQLSKDFCINPTEAQKEAYIDYLTGVLVLSGEERSSAQASAEAYFRFEQEISKYTLNAEEYANSDKTYNIYKYDTLKLMFPNADLDALLLACSLRREDEVLVTDAGLLRALSRILNDDANYIGTLKSCAKLTVLMSLGALLDDDFYALSEELNSRLFGISGGVSERERTTLIIGNMLPDYLGRLYAEKYFDAESKRDIEEMVSEIIAVYKDRIDSLSWMSAETKSRAKRKLDTMKIKVGYPDDSGTFLDNVSIKAPEDGGSYFENVIAISKAYLSAVSELQGGEVDKGTWIMYPYTVNACYSPTSNDITFPAAILQPPMYDKNAPREKNLGAIGYIIAHEITHAFDNNGAKYDENGNAADWWTKDDYSAFTALCDKVVVLYDGEEGIPGIPMNGRLTLSENVSDLGAVSCITEVAKRLEDPDFKLLYRSVASSWAITQTRDFAKYNATVDVHSDGKLRVNRVLQNIDEFYTAFGIKEGDGMYLPPKKRVKIW